MSERLLQPQLLRQLVTELLEEEYVLLHRGKYKFTDKFYKELTGTRQGLTNTSSGELVVVEPLLPLNIPKEEINWVQAYIKFISAAQVPSRLEDNLGRPYYTNKY